WCHGAGWFGGGETPGVEGVAELTGIAVNAAERPAVLRVRVDNNTHPLVEGVPSGTVFGAVHPMGAPLVHPVNGASSVLASVLNTSIPGVAAVRHNGGYSVYSVAPRIPPRLLQNLAREAGVH